MVTYNVDVINAEKEPLLLLFKGRDELSAFKHSKTNEPNAKRAI